MISFENEYLKETDDEAGNEKYLQETDPADDLNGDIEYIFDIQWKSFAENFIPKKFSTRKGTSSY